MGQRSRLTAPLGLVAVGFGIVYALYAADLLLFTGGGGTGPRNLVPLRTVLDYVTETDLPYSIRFRNLAGNLVVLLPFGVLLGALTRLRPRSAIAIGAVVAVAIEGWQFVAASGRSVDIDDVLLNTVGAACGYGLALAGLALVGRISPGLLDAGDAG